MTKLGAFLLKKLNFMKLAFIFLVGASLLFSCKSTPDIASVDPFDLLDGDAALYLSVPVQANQDFVVSAIQKISGTTEADAKKIAERLDMAFVAVGTNGEVQLSASGKIPQSFLGMALNEKKGWKPGLVSQQTVYTHQKSLYQLCLPSSSNAFLSHNIEPMVSRFNKIAYSEAENTSVILSEAMDEGMYKLLHNNSSADIVMYSPAPKYFMKPMLGSTPLKIELDSFVAILSQYRGVKEQFNIRFVINLSDSRKVKATVALLKTLLFGVPAKIVQTGENQITITDLPVSKERILSVIR